MGGRGIRGSRGGMHGREGKRDQALHPAGCMTGGTARQAKRTQQHSKGWLRELPLAVGVHLGSLLQRLGVEQAKGCGARGVCGL